MRAPSIAFHLEWLAHVECFRSDARHTTKWKKYARQSVR
jgi:hypothetical protein